MRKLLTAALAVLAIGGAAVASSADAAPWHHGGGWHDGWRGGWRGAPGWRVGYGPRVFGPPAYFVGADYWGIWGGCRTHWVWNPRWGHYDRVAACY